jgi:uncharacterized protein (DUF1697 family)
MPTHVAFLRGINVGGKNLIKMADLIEVFGSLKFRDVSTILASGNVLFTAPKSKSEDLSAKIQSALTKAYKKEIGVIVRTAAEIHEVTDSAPFKKFNEIPATRHFVTFLSADSPDRIKAPWKSEKGDVTIIQFTNRTVCWIAHPAPGRHSGDCLTTLEKLINKNVTTRSWNTILKIAKVSTRP